MWLEGQTFDKVLSWMNKLEAVTCSLISVNKRHKEAGLINATLMFWAELQACGVMADFLKLQRMLPSSLDRITYYLYAQRLSLVGAYVVTLKSLYQAPKSPSILSSTWRRLAAAFRFSSIWRSIAFI